MVSSFRSALRPTSLAFLASSARSASVNRIRLPRSRSLSRRFSVWRNSMTMSWGVDGPNPTQSLAKKTVTATWNPCQKVYNDRGRFGLALLRARRQDALTRTPATRSHNAMVNLDVTACQHVPRLEAPHQKPTQYGSEARTGPIWHGSPRQPE